MGKKKENATRLTQYSKPQTVGRAGKQKWVGSEGGKSAKVDSVKQ